MESNWSAFLPPRTRWGFGLALLALLSLALISFRSHENQRESVELTLHTIQVIQQADQVLSQLKDAETGQRGFLLTESESYLTPYHDARAALPHDLKALEELTRDYPEQAARVQRLKILLEEKLKEIEATIRLGQNGERDRALRLVHTNRGQALMVRLREVVSELVREERALQRSRTESWERSAQLTLNVSLIGMGVLLVLIFGAALAAARDFRAQRELAWIRRGQTQLSLVLQGEDHLDTLGKKALAWLVDFLDAQVGTLSVTRWDDSFLRIASHALSPSEDPQTTQPSGSQLVGQAIRDRRTRLVTDVPEGYLPISSTLGEQSPRQILIAPLQTDQRVHAVVELGFFRKLHSIELDFIERVSEPLALAIRSTQDRLRLQELLEETQQLAEELQAQQEELRSTNEELVQRETFLEESRAQLEAQQSELEETNAHLEEQTRLLEEQKRELAHTQELLLLRAEELELSNQYKSEFLANMSHELRTPLNSSLILARLLADNEAGNLTEEQVQFAETISNAGKDLLTLINDILDHAKIESGQLEIFSELFSLRTFLDSLERIFAPLALEKRLELRFSVAPEVPERIETDRQRLDQILKNLLSNAVKFTSRGSVTLQVSLSKTRDLLFSVEDTGIGISPEQQRVIFDAFRQADGSTHRKYGGTGLGLSISRDLALLLGGEVEVQSQVDTGSTFTLKLPQKRAHQGELVLHQQSAEPPSSRPERAVTVPASSNGSTNSHARTFSILVVEDDKAERESLRELLAKQEFEIQVCATASQALDAIHRQHFDCVVLDLHLPDGSGAELLEKLRPTKRAEDRQLRLPPVIVYTGKNVTRDEEQHLRRSCRSIILKDARSPERLLDEISWALQQVEAELDCPSSEALSQGNRRPPLFTGRRILIVEDDVRNIFALSKILEAQGAHLEIARSGSEALSLLEAQMNSPETELHLVLMDVMMPEMDGLTATREIRKNPAWRELPVITITAKAMRDDREQCLEAGANDYISKPLDVEKLLSLVHTWMPE